MNKIIDVGAAGDPIDIDGEGSREAVVGGDIDSETMGGDKVSVDFDFGDGAMAWGGGEDGPLPDMDADGTDATIGPIGGRDCTGDDEESDG